MDQNNPFFKQVQLLVSLLPHVDPGAVQPEKPGSRISVDMSSIAVILYSIF